jgi:hypothetical protein
MYATPHAATSIKIGEDDFLPSVAVEDVGSVTDGAQPANEIQPPLDVAASFSRFNHSIFNASFAPPPFWRRFRFYLPSTVAELKITPIRAEHTVDGALAKQSARLVISVGMTPDDPRKYVSDFVSYIFQVSEHLASSAPIFSLRFVKMGTQIHQCLIDFGTDCLIAQKFAACLGEVGFTVGFASPTQQVPTATISVLDVKRVLNNGQGATEGDIISLFGLPQNELRVIEGFEEGLFYAAMKKADIAFAWLCNPFVSAHVQRELFQKFGLLVGAVQAEHNFALKGIPYHLQKKDALASMQDAYTSTADQAGTAFENYENQNEADEEVQDFVKNRDKAVDLFATEIPEKALFPISAAAAPPGFDVPPLLEDDDPPLAPTEGDTRQSHRTDELGRQLDDSQILRWDLPAYQSQPILSSYPPRIIAPIVSLLPAPLIPKVAPSLIDNIRSSSSVESLQQILLQKLTLINSSLQSSASDFRPLFVNELMRHSVVNHSELFNVFVGNAGLMQVFTSLLEDEKAQSLLASQFLSNAANANVTHLLVRSLKANPAVSNPLIQKLCDPVLIATTLEPSIVPHVLVMLQAALDAMSPPQQNFVKGTLSSVGLLSSLFHSSGASGRAISRILLQAAILQGQLCAETFLKQEEPLSETDINFLVSILQSPRVNSETAAFFGWLLRFAEKKEVLFAADGLLERLVRAVLAGIFLPDGKGAFCKVFFDHDSIVQDSSIRQMLSVMQTSGQIEKQHTGFRLVATPSVPVVLPLAQVQKQPECPPWGVPMGAYPSSGAPFSLPDGFSAHFSRSQGHYFFRNASGASTYKHPQLGKGFVATPQAFTLDAGLDAGDIAKDTGLLESEVKRWLANQTLRNPTLDNFVIDKLGIKYRDSAQHGTTTETANHPPPTKDSLAAKYAWALASFAQAPKRGHIFPNLPKGWTCNLSTSHGLYYFRPPKGDPVYRHPTTNKEYLASPQAFALHLKLQVEAVAAGSQKKLEDVEEWIADQRVREASIDSFVLKELGVRYREEEPQRERSNGRRRKRSRGH